LYWRHRVCWVAPIWQKHLGANFLAVDSANYFDLLMFKGSQRIGMEFERTDVPKLTQSIRIAQTDLGLDALYLVYSGLHCYPVADGVLALTLRALLPTAQ
jgi:hypothetical protein